MDPPISDGSSLEGVDRKVVDARAAALRAQVEQLAKASFLEQSQATARIPAAASNSMLPQVPGEAGDELPLLITSTDMGVYVKWALLLQEELQRSLTMQGQLQELRGKLELENASLCDALGRPRRPVPLPQPVAPVHAPPVDASGPSAAAEPAASGLISAMPPPSLPSGAGATYPGLSGMVQHATPQVAAAGKRTLSTMVGGPRERREKLEDLPALSASGAADCSGGGRAVGAAAAPPERVARLQRGPPLAALPMSSHVSLSDLELPSSPELGRLMGLASSQMPPPPPAAAQLTLTPGGHQRLVNSEEESLLESLLSSPSLNPDLLSTPNLRQLSSAIDARTPANAWTDRCGGAGNAFASVLPCVPSK